VAGKVVTLSTTFGTLSANSVTTGAEGRASFTLTSYSTGSATVTASFSYVLPAGTRMVKLPGQNDQQVIVLGTPQTGNVIASASKVWETGTKIIVHKFSDNNTNGVQDGGEESLQGWSMTLERWTGSAWQTVTTKSTDAAGNASFGNLSPGTYRAVETLQSGWTNTTPNPSAQVTLPEGGQATINFGNVALAVIRAWKFHDLNMDGVRSAGEPVLDGWQMNIQPAINGIGSGLTAGGSYSFIDLPPGTYRVWETQQADWLPTTLAEQYVTVGANDFAEVWFGNVRLDLGDLPVEGTTNTPYPVHYATLMAHDGPRHVIRDIQLGTVIDAEADGCPCYCCGGDDRNKPVNDEDGVVPVALSTWEVGPEGGAVDVQVTAIGSSGVATGYVNGWIDWNQNGTFDAGEQILVDAPAPVGMTTRLVFDIPSGPPQLIDSYYARFRLYDAPQTVRAATPTGLALNGEVEDYRWDFRPLAVTLAAFDAQPYEDGVLVTWETVSEINNTGFNLYRAEDAAGLRTLLTFLASPAPGSLPGASYSYEDAPLPVGQTYWYWIEDISTSGTAAWHGPVNATTQAPTSVGLTRVQAASAGSTRLAWPAVLALLALGMIAGVRQNRPGRPPG
jgi:hypothetical protein